jgi:hypothetical protein
VRWLAVRQALVRISARHPMEVPPTESVAVKNRAWRVLLMNDRKNVRMYCVVKKIGTKRVAKVQQNFNNRTNKEYSKGNDVSLRFGGPKHTLAGLNHVGASESAPSLAESPGSGPVGHAHYSALPGLHQARAPPLRYTTEHLSNTGLSQNDST